MIDNLNVIQKIWSNGEYGTYLDDDFTSVDVSAPFNATGRWDYSNNLEQIGIWTAENNNEQIRKAYDELCAELSDKIDTAVLPTAWVAVYFKEDECGYQILRECHAEINLHNGNLTGFIIETTDYDYTVENLVSLGFYDSIDDAQYYFAGEES